jgi:uncharacterized protein with HEPN domain
MKRRIELRLMDIVEHIALVQEFTQGMTCATFRQDRKTILAVARALEVIGESVKHIPNAVLMRYPDIPWKQVGAMRDVIAHDYFGLDEEEVWNVIERRLPALQATVEQIRSDHAAGALDELLNGGKK